MGRISGLVMVGALVLWPSLGLGQKLPDVGEQIYTSDDYANIKSGCIIGYNAAIRELVCASTMPNGQSSFGTPTSISLTQGKTTTVADAQVTAASQISCGCGATDGSHAPACANGGEWLGRVRIGSVTAGSFTISHSYAIGGERITCYIP